MSQAKQPPPGEPRTRKVRTDAVLHALPEVKQLEIISRLKAAPGEVVSRELREESPPIIISRQALQRFAAYWRAESRFLDLAGYREAVLVRMEEERPSMDLERLERWGDLLFLQAALAENNLKGYTGLRGVMERAKQTKLDAKRLAMLEAKEAKLAKLEEELKSRQAAGGLSPETLEQMESLLGMIQS